MILCLGPTPATQRVMVFRRLETGIVNRAAETLDGFSGKSVNVAKVLATLGEQPLAIGFLGGERGDLMRSGLKARGIKNDFVEVQAPTRQCTTVIDQASGEITELVEESRPVPAAAYRKLAAFVRMHIRRSRAIVLSGSLTPGGPVDFYARCVRMANQAGVLSVVDAQGAPLLRALPARPGLVKPNRTELAATVGRKLQSDTDVFAAMRELHARGAQRVVVTAGAGPTLAFDGRGLWRIRSPRVKALNPIGSGDSFTAALVWRLVRGDDLGEACRWACAAGAANTLTLMGGELSKTDVLRLARAAKAQGV